MSEIRTRIAPSPTGYAHLGLLSRILIDYAFAKKNGGRFIWRNEDTDVKRFVADSLEYNMKWIREFGLDWDEGPDKGGPYAPYNQTERLELYKEGIDTLINKDYAYRCFCSEERLKVLKDLQIETGERTHYDGLCRNLTQEEINKNLENKVPFTVRIKVPKDRIIHFDDAITRTHITWNTNDVDDYIIVKSNGIPTYHFAAMYDDVAMKISHIFRGSEWISTTPVHLLVLEGLGVAPEDQPKIGHFTVILDPATPGKKFSKRNSSFRINGLLQQGYLKEAILNYLMLLGWAPKDNRELFTVGEFVEAFDLNGMQKANPTWDQKKMDWFNGVYLRKLSDDDYLNKFKEWITKYLLTAKEDELTNNFIKAEYSKELLDQDLAFAQTIADVDSNNLLMQLKLVKERAFSFWEALQQIKFFYQPPKNINWAIPQTENFREQIKSVLEKIKTLFENMDNDSQKWNQEGWVDEMKKLAQEFNLKNGDPFMILRIAIVGGPFSPPLYEALQILGKEEVLTRISNSL